MPTRVDLVNQISNQLSGLSCYNELYGNYHGRIWYILVAFLKYVFGITDTSQAFAIWQAFQLSIMFMSFPFFLSELDLSNIEIFLSSVLLVGFGFPAFYTKTDGAVAGFVVSVLTIPLLCGLLKKEPFKRDDWKRCGIIILISAFCNIPRQQSSFSTFIVLTGVLLFRLYIFVGERNYIEVGKIAIWLLLAFFIINKADELAYMCYKICGGKLVLTFEEQPWHSIFIGFGYLNNAYGMEYTDSSAMDYVVSINPKIIYCSKEYFSILKERVIEMTITDSLFVINSMVAKFAVSICLLFKYCLGWIPTLILSVYVRIKRIDVISNSMLKLLIVSALLMVIGTAQGVLAIPQYTYIYPSIGAFVTLQVICSARLFHRSLIKKQEN